MCRLSDKREAPLRSSADLRSLGSALSGAQGPDTAVVVAGHQAVERDRFPEEPKKVQVVDSVFIWKFIFVLFSLCFWLEFMQVAQVFCVFVCGVCFSVGFDGQFLRIRLRFVEQRDK